MKIALTSVFVNNPAAAFKFYTEILGFVEKLKMPEANLFIVASAEEPNSTSLMLEPNENAIAKTYQEGIYSSNIPVIVFSVDDINKEYELLKALGVQFKNEPVKTHGGTEATFDDGFGNLIKLYQF
ncbi:VOC family protein [Pedobacter nototheniae]|uniref:VOC family protein n=1 Tax=Pedobacter nototheniae TaxID=2488994 RepID=UPI00103DA25C|nr:VOC family protein [Pedobacter nototheniae]